MDIFKIEIFGDTIQVRYVDGSREEVSGGIYERKDTNGDTVEQRAATAADVSRLSDLAVAFEAEVKPLDANVVEVQIVGSSIDVYYDDGTKESIDGGTYEIKDANNDTIFSRAATSDDIDRLFSLEAGETSAGTQGTGGTNVIDGTAGDDDIDGTSGADVMDGGDGNDRLRGRRGDDDVSGGNGNDRVRGDGGNDTVHGNDGNDRVRGGRDDDQVFGDAGNDKVIGNSGNDTLSGGTGDDVLKGGLGDDILNGNSGSDRYDGGLGADTFVFEADGVRDKINDFEDGIDMIDLSAFGLADASELNMLQKGADVLILLGGGDSIKVDDVTVGQLTDADFIF